MFWINDVFDRLAAMAGVGLVILATGTLLTWCWRRPIERLRCIQATYIALIAGCLLQQFHFLPRVSLGWLPGSGGRPTEMSTTANRHDGGDFALAPVRNLPLHEANAEWLNRDRASAHGAAGRNEARPGSLGNDFEALRAISRQ